MKNSIKFLSINEVVSLDTFIKHPQYREGRGVIFFDRNLVRPVTNTELKGFFSLLKNYKFSIILSASEGNKRQFPSFDDYIKEYRKSTNRLQDTFGIDKIENEKDAMVKSFYHAMKDTHEKYFPYEKKFIELAIKILNDKKNKNKLNDIIKLIKYYCSHKSHKINPLFSLVIICQLYKGKGKHFIEQLLKKDKAETIEQKTYNIANDLVLILLTLLSGKMRNEIIQEALKNQGKITLKNGEKVFIDPNIKFWFCTADSSLIKFYNLYVKLHYILHYIYRVQKKELTTIDNELKSICKELFPSAKEKEIIFLLNNIHLYIL